MAAGSSGPKKFPLDLHKLRSALGKAEATAAKSVAHGTKRCSPAARASCDAATFAANKNNLVRAKKAQKNIYKSIQLLSELCCDQLFDCDPEFK